MGYGLAEKIIKDHLVSGTMKKGEEIGIRIDETLTQDATGTMAYLEFERMHIPRVRTELSVAYIDHNTLQCGFENADDHRLIQSAAEKFGVVFSRAGNGICHQVHLERFGKPGKTLLGSDSHTPTAGALGMLAIGAGGMDVAAAMGGSAYLIPMPGLIFVELKGRLRPHVTAKDVALKALQILSVKGGVGYVIEWGGEGVRTLSVPERATIANMGAETGATTSIFPSDEMTRRFLYFQGREADYIPLESDPDAGYEKKIVMDLSMIEPLAACPHSPDRVVPVKSLSKIKVDQVCIGSCTNSSLQDLINVAAILKGKTVAPSVSLSISPGSKQVLTALADSGALSDIVSSGARVLECACGPCIGMGLSPGSGEVSLRTFNRNFEARSGTKDASVYLVSPETAAVSALYGRITDPEILGELPAYPAVKNVRHDESGLVMPADPERAKTLELKKGPNIGEIPMAGPLPDRMDVTLILKVGDHITTDHIMPAGAAVLPYRSNIPKLSLYCFRTVDETFAERAGKAGISAIVGGINYGQGSSREHAALAPLYLGVRAVIAKSFARIHRANLINAGILPLTFKEEADYDRLHEGDHLIISDILSGLQTGEFSLLNETTGQRTNLLCKLEERQRKILLAGGLLAYVAENGGEKKGV